MWAAGEMCIRVANVLTTWLREIEHGEMTSDLFALAVEEGVMRLDDLVRLDPTDIARTFDEAGLVGHTLDLWDSCRAAIVSLAPRVRSVCLEQLADGLTTVLDFDLALRHLT